MLAITTTRERTRTWRCSVCSDAIEAHEPRLAIEPNAFTHVPCALSLHPRELPLRGLRACGLVDERALEQLSLRRDAIAAQELHSAILRARSNARPVPAQRFASIDPICDRRARPIVRVYCDVARDQSVARLLRAVRTKGDIVIASTEKRTYHFVEPIFAPHIEDPAIATVGALVIIDADTRPNVMRARTIAALAAQDIATPMLWVFGGDASRRATTERRVRAWLSNAGFSGDEATVILSANDDDEARRSVLEAMDCTLVAPRWPPLLAHTPASLSERHHRDAVATLDALLEDGDEQGAKKLLQLAVYASKRSAGEREQRLAARVARSLSCAAIRPTALTLCALALRPQDAAPLCEWFEHTISTRARLTSDMASAARTLIALDFDPVIAPLVALFSRSKSDAVLALICRLLERAQSAAFAKRVIEAMRDRETLWSASDARAQAATKLNASLIERFREDRVNGLVPARARVRQ